MNFESTKWRREAIDEVVIDDETLARRRRRRNIILAVVGVILVAIVGLLLLLGGGEQAAAPAGAQGEQRPAVTVIVPGRQNVTATISATGSLAARRDMPVGVPGEGGQIARVLVEPGQWVNAGQTLAVIDRSVQAEEAAQLAAQIEVDRAELRLAQNELERAQALVSRGFISQADLDRKRAARDGAAARVRVAEAQLAAARARIGRLDVRAPTAGLVLSRSVEAGQVVGPGTGALFRIAANGEMELRARLPQSDLARLAPGRAASVTPVGSSQSYQGTIWQVSPIVDPETRQGEARILIPFNAELRPGGFASAEIAAGTTNAPLLPESAVMSDTRGSFVYVVDAEGAVHRRDVRIGEVSDRGMAITSGLTGNERVVLSAGVFLSPGQRVRPEPVRADR
ncbi:efflux RND transporter periplasmic adaptor subunit [Sphingosinicella sp. CPCC 101087]|uniref:efflux RND transporter periplasmic adaptor subunit n=1 Tax=Sphingosinicella sp. CPCC 101087 TaxID=2497754 RepID=UPI00101C3E8F|nr:efflux RND transporter periplasmic adaptor subunit [Sphingosinicella sp. CPCC 101087]